MHEKVKVEQDKKKINFIQRNPNLLFTWLLSSDDCAHVCIYMASGEYTEINLTIGFHTADIEDLLNVLMLFSIVFTISLTW